VGSFLLELLTLGCINAILVLGFNLQYGYAGLLNFTYITYVAMGAYFTAVTTMGPPDPTKGVETYILQWSLPWPIGLFLGGIAATALGLFIVLITIRRLRMDYFAIVTVSVGLICWNVIQNFVPLFNGSNGIFGVPPITGSLDLSRQQETLAYLALSLFILLVFLWINRQIFHSPFGRVLRAVREDDVVAESFGKRVVAAQISVFVLGCFMGGFGGGLLVLFLGAWSPYAWLPQETFILLSAMIIGGTGNYWGALFGAFVIIDGLDELARLIPDFGHLEWVGAFRAILIGVGLILFLMFKPEGVIPERAVRFYAGLRNPAVPDRDASRANGQSEH
jgi:ABC-type branched-subunit amino acid transport system permease subunit